VMRGPARRLARRLPGHRRRPPQAA
jgi:hypothetical protein